MKISRSIVSSRRERILETVRNGGDVSVNSLSEQLQVSPLTIRRDLQYLEEHKLLERFYGGARTGNAEERIARYAAGLVEDGDSILLNTSSTALAMVKYITSRNVTIITNNGNIINEENPSQATIVLLGGELRYQKGAMVGDFTKNSLAYVAAKKCFVGCTGISPDIGMVTEMMSEVNLNQMMFQRVTGTTYILADSSKFGIRTGGVSCPPEKIENIITDVNAPAQMVREFREMGTWVYQVD